MNPPLNNFSHILSFSLDEDFGIMYYDHDFSLVSYLNERTDDLGLSFEIGKYYSKKPDHFHYRYFFGKYAQKAKKYL